MDFTPYLTVTVTLLGILIGTLISPRIQHKIGTEYNRRGLIFQRKLTYFEGVIENIERNKRMYYNLIRRLEESQKNSEIDKIIEELKKDRKTFFISSSSLYFNTKIISEKIIRFVSIEKDIFTRIDQLKKKNKEDKIKIIAHIKENLKSLNKRGEEVLYEMRHELSR